MTTIHATAADGRTPATPDQLFDRLKSLGIETTTHEHAPVFTVDEARSLRGVLPGGHSKNLFLRGRKGEPILIVAEEDRPIDLKALGRVLSVGKLSFGSAERLRATLGVEPGSVTPFALLNDVPATVDVVLDAALMRHDPVNFHPLVNTMTTAIRPGDLIRFIESCGHRPRLMDLDQATP